jgi:hypothetical protein
MTDEDLRQGERTDIEPSANLQKVAHLKLIRQIIADGGRKYTPGNN